MGVQDIRLVPGTIRGDVRRLSGMDLRKIRSEGWSVEQLYMFGFDAIELLQSGTGLDELVGMCRIIPAEELRACSISCRDVVTSWEEVSVADLGRLGWKPGEVMALMPRQGWRGEHFLLAGIANYNSIALSQEIGIVRLVEHGVSSKQLFGHGFSMDSARAAVSEVKRAKGTNPQVWVAPEGTHVSVRDWVGASDAAPTVSGQVRSKGLRTGGKPKEHTVATSGARIGSSGQFAWPVSPPTGLQISGTEWGTSPPVGSLWSRTWSLGARS